MNNFEKLAVIYKDKYFFIKDIPFCCTHERNELSFELFWNFLKENKVINDDQILFERCINDHNLSYENDFGVKAGKNFNVPIMHLYWFSECL